MKNAAVTFGMMLTIASTLSACNSGTNKQNVSSAETIVSNEDRVVNSVMTKEEQEKLTPDVVLQDFKAGNTRFHNKDITKRDHSEQVRKSAVGQFPKAVVLSCLDSRVTVEDVFDQGIGDVFVGRVAGNFINEDLLGSLEFASKVAGAKLILVMGHQHCGAVKAAIDDVKLGNITVMLSKIKPAVAMSQDFKGEKTSKNEEFVKYVSENNVRYAMNQIREKSPIIKELEEKGQVKIVGVFYRLTDGTIEFLN
ncbi:carbonic anhydrase family protein [Daejeonella oryzae]|uniref:carbonic anhydrase family protein n=1 Tax=Daejeonella oryzae TaxID=1122943 RepID=UPI00047D4E3B|nr:carbonic anhydrase family protein [Daejeonella oryzae]